MEYKYIKYWMNSNETYKIIEFYEQFPINASKKDIIRLGNYLYNYYGYSVLEYGDEQLYWDYQEISKKEYEKNKPIFEF